jgi:hypothetical protein
MTPDQVIAAATVVNTIALLVTLGYLRAQVRAMRDTAEADVRPYVVVGIDWSEAPVINIYIENLGRTIAKDVSVSFFPPLRSTLDGSDSKVSEMGMFTKPIPNLAPGTRMQTMFDVGHQRASAELDDSYRVDVRYSGHLPGRRGETTWTETQTIDIGVLWGMTYTPTKTLDDVVKSLDKIVQSLRKA